MIGLIGGSNIHKYSIAKSMWNNFFKITNENNFFEYIPCTTENQVLECLWKLKNGLYDGVQIALPWKNFVASKIDSIDESGYKINLVNTIKYIDNKFIGTNTDGIGFLKGLEKENFKLNNCSVLIIGCGGAGSAISLALLNQNIKNIYLYDIDIQKTKNLFLNLNNSKINIIDLKGLKLQKLQFDVIVNATAVGANGFGFENEAPIPLELIKLLQPQIVAEVIYNPNKTELLKFVSANFNISVMLGVKMLAYQAALAYDFFYAKNNVDKNGLIMENIIIDYYEK